MGRRPGPIILSEDLPEVRKRHPDEVIVFASGAFDLIHAGHVLFLEDCKRLGNILVVEVAHDALLRKNKGSGRPIQNEQERLKMVSALKPVDYCFLDRPVEGHSFIFFNEALAALKPDKWVVNEDAADIPYREEIARSHGVEFVVLRRWCPPEFEGISTSRLIEKIRSLEE